MKIREIQGNDKEEWIKIAETADNRKKEWSEQKFSAYFNSKKKKRLIVIEEDGKLTGYIAIKGEDVKENVPDELNNNYLLVNWIAVLPTCRKKGLGSQLLKKAEEYARKWEKKGIWLGCQDDRISFYEKNGYKKQGTFMNYSEKEENLMVKEIR